MTTQLSNELFTLELPLNWTSEEMRGSIAVFKISGGTGALNVSATVLAHSSSKSPLDLLNLLSRDAQVDAGFVMPNGLDAVHANKTSEAKLWRYWVIMKQPIAVIASYNCPIEFESAEEADIDAMVSSIKIRDLELRS